MELARASGVGNRPSYLDRLYFGLPPLPPPVVSPSAWSTNSSISSLDSQLSATERTPHKRLPVFEKDFSDDRISMRSLRFRLSPRFNLRNILRQRSHTQVQETAIPDVPSLPRPVLDNSWVKQPNLSRPQTAQASPPRRGPYLRSKTSPSSPTRTTENLHCTPCYYFAARNCSGYVLGGGHGDACENCAVSCSGPLPTVLILKLSYRQLASSALLECVLAADSTNFNVPRCMYHEKFV